MVQSIKPAEVVKEIDIRPVPGKPGYWEEYETGRTKHVPQQSGHYLLHCNWGWGGTADGYYHDRMFNTAAGPIHTDDELGEERSTGSYDFNIDLDIFKYKMP